MWIWRRRHWPRERSGGLSRSLAGLAALLDAEGKEYADAGLKYLRVSEAELLARIERTPKLLKLPLVRGPGNKLTLGSDEAGWKAMVTASQG